MAISDILNRRVRAQPDEYDDDIHSEDSNAGEEVLQEEDEDEGSEGESDEDLQSQDREAIGNLEDNEDESGNPVGMDESFDVQDDDDSNDLQASLSDISFGALVKAQASMGPEMRKNKKARAVKESASKSPLDDIRTRILEAREQKRAAASKTENKKHPKDNKAARASKHAPMEMSSKRAVSRKRTVVEPPAVAKARDPRFDAAVMGHSGAGRNPEAARKAYAFLDEYRASELKDLKAELARTKDVAQKEAIKKQIRSATDRMKAMESKQRERDLMAEHKKREKQMLREGTKSTPYYLKKSDLKKQVLQKKYEEMGSRDRAKALERRRKKMAAKERKDMPMERRGMNEESSRGEKRRRLA